MKESTCAFSVLLPSHHAVTAVQFRREEWRFSVDEVRGLGVLAHVTEQYNWPGCLVSELAQYTAVNT